MQGRSAIDCTKTIYNRIEYSLYLTPYGTSFQQVLSKLVQDSRNPPEPALIPSRGFLTPAGGQLVQTLVGHSASAVYGLSATSDGKCVVTGTCILLFML